MSEMLFLEHDDESSVTDKPHCSDCFRTDRDDDDPPSDE